MERIVVNLDSIHTVKDFLSIITKYPFSADLTSGRYVVDAKSIMGIFSLDISKPITLCIYSEDDCVDEFKEEIKRYIVENS